MHRSCYEGVQASEVMRLSLLSVLLLLVACGSGQLPAAECNALDETRTKLLLKSKLAVDAAIEIQQPIRQARYWDNCGSPYDSQIDWRACMERQDAAIPPESILTTIEELSRLGKDNYVPGLAITSPRAQQQVELSKEYLEKAKQVTEKMDKGSCIL